MIGLLSTIVVSLLITSLCLLRGIKTSVVSQMRPAFIAILGLLLITAMLFWQTTGLRQVFEWQRVVEKSPSLLELNTKLNASQQRELALSLRTRLQDDPSNAHGWALLGRMQEKLGNNHEALAAFYRAWKQNPTDIKIVLNYSSALILAGGVSNIEQAIDLLTQLHSRNRDNIQIMSQLAYAALSKQDTHGAVQWFTRILSQLPQKDPRREFIQKMITSLPRQK